MSQSNDHGRRTLALWGATSVGAVALNGGIALLPAPSFADLASRFPESGGTYTYARKVLTVEAFLAVGSVVVAVLYALGFAVFLIPFLRRIGRRRKVFGEQMLEIAQAIKCPLLMINHRN
jgi:amino acid transporter